VPHTSIFYKCRSWWNWKCSWSATDH